MSWISLFFLSILKSGIQVSIYYKIIIILFSGHIANILFRQLTYIHKIHHNTSLSNKFGWQALLSAAETTSHRLSCKRSTCFQDLLFARKTTHAQQEFRRSLPIQYGRHVKG